MAVKKPGFNIKDIWAAGALATDKARPSDGKIQIGWAFGENPPFQIFNWFWNKLAEYTVHVQENGIPTWDKETEYQVGAVTIYNTILYHSQALNKDKQPDVSTEWRKGLPSYEGAQIPVGGVTAYAGKFSDIPTGWALCNGQNGTVDLTDKFIKSTADESKMKTIGGYKNSTLLLHTHTGSTQQAGEHEHKAKDNNHTMDVRSASAPGAGGDVTGNSLFIKTSDVYTEKAGLHAHTFTTAPAGEPGLGKNEPPFVYLAYIQRIA